jgi:hypothetical protein
VFDIAAAVAVAVAGGTSSAVTAGGVKVGAHAVVGPARLLGLHDHLPPPHHIA